MNSCGQLRLTVYTWASADSVDWSHPWCLPVGPCLHTPSRWWGRRWRPR